jgi:peptidase E
MELHLFSTPGPGFDITWVLDACREILGDRPEPSVAYLPMGVLNVEKWLGATQRSFQGIAKVEVIRAETMEVAEMERIVRSASLAYVPGGNAFLLNHRLHASRLFPYLQQKVRNGLPVVAFSAGAVVCGPNVLTSNDLNSIPTTHFDSLAAVPFNLNVHYTDNADRNEWLADYGAFHDNPVVMLEDGAYVKQSGKKAALVRGPAWLWRPGRDKERLEPGEPIPSH